MATNTLLTCALEATLQSIECWPEPLTGRDVIRMLTERLIDDDLLDAPVSLIDEPVTGAPIAPPEDA